MVTGFKKRKSTGSKRRFIGMPTGQIQERVQAVGPEHFDIVSVDCAKRRSKWMLCNFYAKVLIEPTAVEHTAGGLRVKTKLVAENCRHEGLTDTIVAIEMTGIYHKPVHPDEKTDDSDLEAIFHVAVRRWLGPVAGWRRLSVATSDPTATTT